MFFSDFTSLVTLILGWLFGLLSPAIVDAIKNQRETKVIKKSLISELQDFRFRLMLNVYTIESKYGELNHEFFEWAQSILVAHKGVNSSESLLNTIAPLLKLSKEEMATYALLTKQQKISNSGLSLRKHSLSLLDTNVGALAKFDPIFRSQLLEVKTRIAFMNEIIDDTRYFYKLSFQENISEKNYEISNSNMISQYKFYALRARDIIKIIGEILDKN